MKNQPLLSIIVPCYNVEKYVEKCITSLVSQTYTNIEILLINDGSTDSTGMICNKWEKIDLRIRVIHKQNEGLPYARKTGIENITAEYVTFLDSDDWIDQNMYSDLMKALITTNSDIAQCGVCEVFEDGRIEHKKDQPNTGHIETFGRIDGVLLILDDKKWRSYMGNKIYKKRLFKNIEFPKGRGYGEDFIAHNLFHNAKQSVYLDMDYYFYLQRNSSITKLVNLSGELKNHRDYINSWQDRYNFIKQHPEYNSAMPRTKFCFIVVGISLLRNIIVYPNYFEKDFFYRTAKKLRPISITRSDKYILRSLMKDFYLFEFYLLKFNPTFYKILRSLYVKIIYLTNKLKITDKQPYSLLSELWKKYEK